MHAEPIEVTVARLDERFQGFETVIKRLAEDQRGLTNAYIELVNQNAMLNVLENDVTELKRSNQKLWGVVDTMRSARENSMRWILAKVFEWFGLLAIGALAAHLGVKLL